MKKLLQGFYRYLPEIDVQESWIMLKSLLSVTSVGFIYAFFEKPTLDNFISSHLNEFNCSYQMTGSKLRPLILNCPNENANLQLTNAAQTDFDSFSFNNFYKNHILVFAIIGLAIGIVGILSRRAENQQNFEEQQKTARINNISELEEEEKRLLDKYGQRYFQVKGNQATHPPYLCEPESTDLIGLPPIVCSDGYARSLSQFKLMIQNNTRSNFSGEVLAPYGIIERVLLGDLLAYIENDNKAMKPVFILAYKKNTNSLFNSVLNLLREIFPVFGKAVIGGGAIFITLFLTAYLLLSLLLPENEFCIDKIFNQAIYGTSLLSTFILFTQLPNLNAWFNLKITEAKYEENAIEDIEEGIKWKIPNRLLCPITRGIFRIPVICEDGFPYEKNAIKRFLESTSIKSPCNPSFKFKNRYPLLWSYVQLQKAASTEAANNLKLA